MIRTLPDFTLGWELEACNRANRVPEGVEAAHDGSVNGDGMEYKIMRNLVNNIPANLHALRELVTDTQVRVNQSCGFHVHVGLGRRTRQAGAWAAWFVSLARSVESSAFQAVPTSRRENSYCRTWSSNKGSVLGKRYPAEKYANQPDRYYWVNVVEMFRPGGIRTVEVRLLGNTHRLTYCLAWIAVCRLMAQSAWACVFDPSKLEGEAHNLKQAFQLISNTYLSSTRENSTEAAKTAIYLMSKAGLLHPTGRPLRMINADEIEIARRSNIAQAEALEFDRLLAEMRLAQVRNQTELETRQRERASSPRVGDMVRIISQPHDLLQSASIVGSTYQVLAVSGPSEGQVQITIGYGPWWIRRSTYELVRRQTQTEAQACAG